MINKAEGPHVARSLAEYLDDALSVLPAILDADQAAEQIAALFAANEGATFNLYFGNMLGKPYYAVSIYLDREARYSVSWPGKNLSLVKLHSLMASSRQLLRDPRNSIGLWYDEETDSTYLEVTATLPCQDEADREDAAALGRFYNQIRMYDLQAREYISLGGTGRLPENRLLCWNGFPNRNGDEDMNKPIETDRVSALVIVAGIEKGEPPCITTVHKGADGRGMHRPFVQMVPILDKSLFSRLSNEVNQGDEITVTVVNEWYVDSHVTYLADFKKADVLTSKITGKNSVISIVRDEITEVTVTHNETVKTKQLR